MERRPSRMAEGSPAMIKPWIFEFFPEPNGAAVGGAERDFSRYFSAYLDLWTRDEALGFEGIFFSEHHFGGAFGASPNLLIAAVAPRTRRLRLGVMGVVASMNAPWRMAEEIGMLDQFTGGRLEIGTAVGIPQELARINLSMAEARERNDEAVAFLDAALQGGPITFKGKYFSCENLRLIPPPLQKPSPPKWTTVVSIESARKAARRHSKIATAFNETARVKEIFDAYRDEADRCGFRVGPDHLGLRRRVIVAESQSEAEEMTAGVQQRLREQLSHDPRANLNAGAAKPAGAVPDQGGGGFTLSADEFISGTPAAVADEIIAQCRHVGAGHFLGLIQWGEPVERVAAGHELFAREIIPRLKQAGV
jgi:alkanesulfonate monooxygenase SsuD/methylene tetrahydromethanopterin reductase-like flavin-dependent oxidoreductase (luciferase family)